MTDYPNPSLAGTLRKVKKFVGYQKDSKRRLGKMDEAQKPKRISLKLRLNGTSSNFGKTNTNLANGPTSTGIRSPGYSPQVYASTYQGTNLKTVDNGGIDPKSIQAEKAKHLKGYFDIRIHNGLSFVKTIELLQKLGKTETEFKFYENRIEIEKGDEVSTTMRVYMFDYMLPCYEVETEMEEHLEDDEEVVDFSEGGEESDENYIRVMLNLDTFLGLIKTVKAKDGIRLIKKKGEGKIYIKVLRQGSESTDSLDVSFVEQAVVPLLTKYTYCEYDREDTEPNCTIESSKIAQAVSSITAMSKSSIMLKAMDDALIFVKRLMGTSGKIVCLGKGGERISQNLDLMKDAVFSMQIELPTLTIMGKLNGLTAQGTVRIFAEKNKPLKLLASIGDYGRIELYIGKMTVGLSS